jgi:RHS repeat-associated protein
MTSHTGDVLAEENWTYNSFQVLTYTDPRRLTTQYGYDGAGRKISENAEERHTTFSYDSLGFLERIDNGVTVLVQKRNLEGLIAEQWEEDSKNQKENRMQFFYNSENQKDKAVRTTSQGDAIDIFTYKNGKLFTHTDPNNAITQFIYNENFINNLGQKVLQKTSIDPHLNSQIETFDASGHLISMEKKDPKSLTTFKEEYFYDCSGNLSKRVSYVYLDGKPIRQIYVTWNHDSMGRVKQEKEAEQKTTTYEYDSRGRIKFKTLPDGVRLEYSYDGADRLKGITSSNEKIQYEYSYEKGPDPKEIKDLVTKIILKRKHNLFGQITSETQSIIQITWNYDAIGRCKSMTLPDSSFVHYKYKDGHMSLVQRKAPDESLLYEHKYTEFDKNGHVEKEELIFNNINLSTTHDLLERPISQGCSLLEHSVEYNLLGQVKAVHNPIFGSKIYEYDSLHQLKSEGDQTYLFDSLGNPSEYSINTLNQIESASQYTFKYDSNGNPIERIAYGQSLKYEYDSLGRLITIMYPLSKRVQYTYDPLSRLHSKETYRYIEGVWVKQKKIYYLYDQECEIGTMDETGRLLEFKVLGLGIKGDIGAAVAIELGNRIYAPLHDFSGNIIALISSEGQIDECFAMDAFGKEKYKKYSSNPWRYCSKRTEEGLIFFGKRFYDPSLKRWLTPDPTGFSDGSNLYLYVLNSPLNRLDLFGLFSEDKFSVFQPVNIYVPVSQILNMPSMQGFLCNGSINGVAVDFYVFHTQWHKLKFSMEELKAGTINLSGHLNELIPSTGKCIGMVSFGNGINTTLQEFGETNQAIAEKIAGPLMISLYNPTEGLRNDKGRVDQEHDFVDTPTVCRTRQFMIWGSNHLNKINPELFWLIIPHSENGLITRRSLEKMPLEAQEVIQKNVHIFALGPADCIPLYYAASVENVFSDQDYVTGFGPCGVAKKYLNHEDYHVEIHKCISSSADKILMIADHGILAPTYKKAWSQKIGRLHTTIGFYGKNKSSR